MDGRQHLIAENVYPFPLIEADIVEIDPIKSDVTELLDISAVRIGILTDQQSILELARSDLAGPLFERCLGSPVPQSTAVAASPVWTRQRAA